MIAVVRLGLAQDTGIAMIDAPHATAHRTASSLAVQKGGADG
ncbi:hypothetical protein [Rhodovulum visakhapatnamense]